MSKVKNFNLFAKDAILDDLSFFFQEVGSKQTSEDAEYLEMTDNIRFSCKSNFPMLNGILQKNSNITSITTAFVQEQIVYFSTQGVPHIWWFTNQEQRDAFAPTLESKGYTFAGEYLGYAAQAETLQQRKLPEMPKDTLVQVKEVQTELEYLAFCKTLGEVFGFDEDTITKYIRMLKNYGPGMTFRHVYATIDNRIVGVMSALLRNGYCGVWNGGVLMQERAHGVGRALCLKIAEIGNEEGVIAFSGILMRDAQAKGLCRKFGAQKVSEIYPYIYGVTSEEFEPK